MYVYMKKLILGFDPNLTRIIPGQQIGTVVLYCKELEEGRKNWLQYKKEATWKHKRVKTRNKNKRLIKSLYYFRNRLSGAVFWNAGQNNKKQF